MAETTEQTSQEFEYQAEMKQLLHLIVHALYTHRDIFLRELISNASDALNKVRFLQITSQEIADPEAPLKVEISADAEVGTLTIEDTGIGMTREELIDRLGTVAGSGTRAFLEEYQRSETPLDGQLIGQFGVGFYAAFMVADEVVVETRHAAPEAEAWRWRSAGEGRYTLEASERTQRGTRITLHLKDDAKEFAEEARVRHIVQRYSNFVDFPIYLSGSQVNTVKALWRKQKDAVTDEERAAFYKFIAHDYQEPLGHLHLSMEGRVSFRALLFIPAQAPPTLYADDFARHLHLYVSGVFIQDDCKTLLPEYLRFVRGVVDTEDLPLNISREVTQASPAMGKIRQVLTSKILGLLEDWAENDADTYTTFFEQFGPLFKSGLAADPDNRDRLIELLRFESTGTEKGVRTSLAEYVARMAEGQKALYYLLGEHRTALERDPKLEYFRKNDLEVLLLTDPVDAFLMPSLPTYQDVPLESIEKADLDLAPAETDQPDALDDAAADQLLARFKTTLGERVEDVVPSKRLVNSAATLVTGKHGLDAQTERLMKMMNQEFAGSRKILEINPAHPLLKNLAALLDAGADDVLDPAILQLYEGALLLDGGLAAPTDFVERMTALLVRATASPEAPEAS